MLEILDVEDDKLKCLRYVIILSNTNVYICFPISDLFAALFNFILKFLDLSRKLMV